MSTYKIVRMFRDDDKPSETIVRGLTLQQAQAHCRREDTHGEGWFDGYDDETEPDPNWHTREVGLWLANDEPMYRTALRCETVDELREAFDDGGIRGVDYSQVDWDALFEQFEEDRNG